MVFWKKPEKESGLVTIGDETVAFSVTRSHKRKRTIAFKMERDKTLTVLAPTFSSISSLKRILQKRGGWIARQLMKREDAMPENNFCNGGDIAYLGRRYRLNVTQNGTESFCRLSPHAFHVNIPDWQLSPDNLQQEIRLEIILWMKKRARIKLKKRCDLWAARMGVTYNKLIITSPERRWGSCSADNIIRLNYRLLLAPLSLIDYVVVHELAHIPQKNHGRDFWGFVGRYMPDYRARRQELRQIETYLNL